MNRIDEPPSIALIFNRCQGQRLPVKSPLVCAGFQLGAIAVQLLSRKHYLVFGKGVAPLLGFKAAIAPVNAEAIAVLLGERQLPLKGKIASLNRAKLIVSQNFLLGDRGGVDAWRQ